MKTIVYYRLCGIKSSNPSPIFNEDKYRLNKLCLKSFVKAFEKVNPEVVFLADFCGQEYEELIKQIVPFKYSYIPTNFGINGTCLIQYEMALKTDHDIIYFAECDYLYDSDAQILLDGVKELKLVSPYDHRNFYVDHTIHSKECTIELVNDYHFRSVERNTMTFAIDAQVFKKNYEIFKKYGYLDNEVWKEMLSAGYPLFVTLPSIATHMVRDYLAPSIDWNKYYGR